MGGWPWLETGGGKPIAEAGPCGPCEGAPGGARPLPSAFSSSRRFKQATFGLRLRSRTCKEIKNKIIH